MRYSPDWVTCLRRLRLNDDWWQEVLGPFQSLNVEKETFENLQMQGSYIVKLADSMLVYSKIC